MEGTAAFSLEGRNVLVTGGAQGIGLAIARASLELGARVALMDLDEEALKQARDSLSPKSKEEIAAICCDVASYLDVSTAAEQLEGSWGLVDVLVNNAGIAYNAPAEEMSTEEWDRMIRINLSAVFYCSQIFGRRMIKARRGSIVNISSMSGLIVNRPQPQVAYNVAKAGVIMLTKSLAAEWAQYRIRVNAVAPGYINTRLISKFVGTDIMRDYWLGGTPMARLGEPHEIANVVVFLASDAASFITGETIVADGGYTLW